MLDPLPDAARVWLFPFDRTLTAPESARLGERVGAWLPTWSSHGRPVQARAEVAGGRVLAVGALISQADLNAGVSGCGIDAMEREVAQALAEAGVALAPGLGVTFRDEVGAWQTVARPAFRRRVRDGASGPDTPVLDVTAETVGAVREAGIERPARDTWAARAFAL